MIVKDLRTLGFSQAEADLLDYIYLHPNCSVQDIVRETNFRQPEVSLLVKGLGNYVSRDLPKHEGKGRRSFTYGINPKCIADIKEFEFNTYVKKIKETLENLRSLETEKH